jgi:hypothetical protein
MMMGKFLDLIGLSTQGQEDFLRRLRNVDSASIEELLELFRKTEEINEEINPEP